MNVLYCGDSNISEGVILSVLSLLHCVNERLEVYILTARINTQDRCFSPLPESFAKGLNKTVSESEYSGSVKIFDITTLFESNPPEANMYTRFTPCCMLRLYADLIPELPEKILYLDNDVLCRGDCRGFYNQNIADYELCGVLDYYGRWFFRKRPFKFDYLNSGVLLLNLKKIRDTGLFEACRKRCSVKQMFMPDQSAINKLAVAKKADSRKYNEQRILKQNTVFQHFTTSFRLFPLLHTVCVKPWDINRVHSVLKLNEYDNLFNEYKQYKAEENQ